MTTEYTALMEPMLPALGNKELEDLAMELAGERIKVIPGHFRLQDGCWWSAYPATG